MAQPSALARVPAPFSFDFMRRRHLWFAIAALLLVVSVLSLALQGFNLGLDFTGGTQIQLAFAHHVPPLARIRSAVAHLGYSKYEVVGSGARQAFLTLPTLSEAQYLTLVQHLTHTLGPFRVVQHNTVGAAVASSIVKGGIEAVLGAAVLIVLYMIIRFDFRYAITGIAAVFWDAIVTMGIVSLLRIEISSAFIAGILTIFGYSLNDRIIIFDRIRENMSMRRKGDPLDELVNRSLNQTLTRSIITALIVIVAMLTVLFLGGASTRDLAATVVIGVFFGAFSSMLFATPLWYSWVSADERAGRVSGGGAPAGRRPRRATPGPRRKSDEEARGIRL
jgi:preprotein translocase subunit SecF